MQKLEGPGMMQKVKKYIAFVCTGNTCRSPMAEGIFNKLAEKYQLDICAESFGISTFTGLMISDNSVEVCKEICVDISEKRSISVNDVSLERYDKFYCMSPQHSYILSEAYGVAEDKLNVIYVSDPYGGDVEIYRHCRDEIYNIVEKIIIDLKAD